jgi:hypothetical protein
MKPENNLIPVRFNEKEILIHEWLKDFFGFAGVHGESSQTIKQAEAVAFNVLRGLFGDSLKDIFKRESKNKLIEIRAIQKEKIRKSITSSY